MSEIVVRFESDGGFAPMPGLRRPLLLDADALAPADGQLLRTLVANARLKAGEATRPAGADGRSYTITVTEDGRSTTATLYDPIEDPAQAALVSQLMQWQRSLS